MENNNTLKRPPCCQLICKPEYFKTAIRDVLTTDQKIKMIDEHQTRLAVHEEILKVIPDILSILQRVQYWIIGITVGFLFEIILKKIGLL